MKYLKLLPFFCILISVSCNKALDTKPQDFLTTNNYFDTEGQLNIALNGVYQTLGLAEVYGDAIPAYVELCNDEIYSTNNAIGVHNLNHDAGDTRLLALWRALYQGIDRANLLLENINKPKMDSAKRSVIEGEAMFLRGYYYFMLASYWGDVPLVLKPTTDVNNTMVARTPAKDVYAQILKDMVAAEGKVKTITSLGFGGRVNKTAVEGILARVCLTMAGYPLHDEAKYVDALAWTNKVISSGEHSLNPDYAQLFINYAADKYDIKESMLEVEFWGNASINFSTAGRIGNDIGLPSTDLVLGYSYGTTTPHKKLYTLYPDSAQLLSRDLRRDWNIATFKYSTSTSGVTTKVLGNTTPASIYTRHMGKWRREYEVVTPKHKNYTPENFVLLRYSDVLLMKAEILNELYGPTAESINLVNMVRRRGWGENLTGNRVYSIAITNGGTGYTVAPTVVLTGGTTGAAATATATVTSGRVTAITINSQGTFYTTPPTVTFTGTVGSGATATAAISSMADANLSSAETSGEIPFRIAIQNERSRELCFESLRRADLIRWGIWTNTMQALVTEINATAPSSYVVLTTRAAVNATERTVLFPIPSRELSLNPLLTQNPGW